MNQTLLFCILNTLLILVTASVSDANLSPSLHWKVEKEALEQNQQKYQKLTDDIKEIKEIINDFPIADPIVDTDLNNTIYFGRKESLKSTNQINNHGYDEHEDIATNDVAAQYETNMDKGNWDEATMEQLLRNNMSTFVLSKDFENDEYDYGVAPDDATEYNANIMKQNRNENQRSQNSGSVIGKSTKKYPKKLVTLNEKEPHNKASDLSPYGKKWREIVQIEDEYNTHNSSMVIHLFRF